jgi:hypothetical protein
MCESAAADTDVFDAAGRARQSEIMPRVVVGVLLAATVISGCAVSGGVASPGGVFSDAPLQPLIVGWERFFRITWQPGERRGQPVVYGRISNEYGTAATRVQLLVEALDASGQVTSQRISWLGRTLGPFDSSYFEAPVPQVAPAYRVSVFAFDWLESDDLDFRRF